MLFATAVLPWIPVHAEATTTPNVPATPKVPATPTTPTIPATSQRSFAPPAVSIVATAKNQRTPVYSSLASPKPFVTFDNKTNFSGRHVFLVLGTEPRGYKVLVPMRPNGRTGYVRTADVTLYQHDYAIIVDLPTKTLVAFKAGKEFLREKVGIGTDTYPTPTGLFFARELARPSNPRGAYGVWAFGLSGYSNVLTKFGRGDGQIGIHGTNQPSKLGTKVSHGCIRMSNQSISTLANILPQGVPVQILG